MPKIKNFYQCVAVLCWIAMLACSASGVFPPTPTPRPTSESFTVVPFINEDHVTPQAGIGATSTISAIFVTDNPGYSGHDNNPLVATSTPFPPCQPGWYQTAYGCNKASYEYFAFTADTCVGMDDNGELFLIVRTSIGAGIDLPNGLRYLSCWMDHPSDFDGYQWYTTGQELPTGIKEVQLYEGDGFPSINYCRGACSTTEDPIWEGWVESSQGNQDVWNLDQKITNHNAFYPDGFVGESTYDFYTR